MLVGDLADLNAVGALENWLSFIDLGKTAFQMRMCFYQVANENDASRFVHATLVELGLILSEKFA